MQAAYSHILITGDFNYKDIDWLTIESKVDIESDTSIFLENIRDLYLTQHVTQPTRFRENQNDSCLDLIFTNEELMIDSLEYLPSLGASDHLVLSFNFVCYIPPDTTSPPKYNFFKGDYVAMREALDGMDWNFSMDCSTDISWENFISILNSVIDKFVPKRSHTYSYKKPWMNSVTAETIDKKRRAWIKLRNCSSDNNISAYKQSRNDATNVIRTAKFEYEKNICSKVKDEPKLFWSYVKSKCKTRDKVCDLMKADGTLTNSGKDKAEVLNDFFVSVFTKENLSFIPTLPDRNKIDSIPVDKFFTLADGTRTRGHKHKLVKGHNRTRHRACIFSQRVINPWNNLPSSCVESDSVNSFKSALNVAWKDHPLKFVCT